MLEHTLLFMMVCQATAREWSYSAPRQGYSYPASIRGVLEMQDVDGDGVDEVLIGRADLASHSNMAGHWEGRGTVLCISGASSSVLWRNDGPTNFDCPNRFGSVLASIGDIDGDAVRDVAIGVPYIPDDMQGFTWNPSAVRSTVRIVSGKDGHSIREHEGVKKSVDGFGVSVAATGDLDDDGLSDYAIGACTIGFYGPHLPASGDSVGIYSARSGELIETLVASSFGAARSFGSAIRDTGDLDADGVSDIAIRVDVLSGFGGSWCVISGKSRKKLFTLDKKLGMIGDELLMLGDRTGDGLADMGVLVVRGEPDAREIFLALIAGKDGSVSKRASLDVKPDSAWLADHALGSCAWRPVFVRDPARDSSRLLIVSRDPALAFEIDSSWIALATANVAMGYGGSGPATASDGLYCTFVGPEGTGTIVKRIRLRSN
jgi:hypothetical protein